MILSSIVSAAALILGAVITFALNEQAKRRAHWRDKKLEYYAGFFDSLAVNLEGYSNDETQATFARNTNNLNLIAPADVLKALHAYREQISLRNPERDYAKDSVLLTALVRAMREDLGMPGARGLSDDMVRLWTPGTRHREQLPPA